MNTNQQKPEQGLKILREISNDLDSLTKNSTDQEVQAVLDLAVERCGQARQQFEESGQPWMAAWVDLKKASLHCELAQGANYMGRGVQAHAAMTLIKDVLDMIQELPPNLDLTAKIYLAMTETLFQVRSLFEKPDQLEAIDSLIRGVSENLGEALALDLLFRAEADDLEFTAGVLEALTEVEEDQEIVQEQTAAVNEIRGQAAARLALTSAGRDAGGDQ